METKTWKLGIIGWPLGYSLSPRMHRAVLKAAGLEGEYKEYTIELDPTDTDSGNYKKEAEWLSTVRDREKLDGLNVSMPCKPQVAAWCLSKDISIDQFAQFMDAVNTIRFENRSAAGCNTDGVGFLQPLRDRGINLSAFRILLLGAGGSAKAIAITLALQREVRHLSIWNRHAERAKMLANRANIVYCDRQNNAGFAEAIQEITPSVIREIDFLVNATPVGMVGQGEVPQEILGQLHEGQIVYDIVYEPRETALIRAARARGCQVITGDEMLAAQGAASFKIWTGIDEVNRRSVLEIMRETLDKELRVGHQ